MIAAVTDLDGRITGAHRTWLNPSKCDKAPIDSPRRAMGHLLGNAVRFETARDVMAAGEGIETMLSLRCVMPTMPLAAALSAAHLAAILFPPTLVGCMSSATMISLGMARWPDCSTARERPGSMRSRCRRMGSTVTALTAF